MVNNNVDWRKVLVKIAGNISTELNLNILVEDFILQEISDRIDNSLDHIEFENPNSDYPKHCRLGKSETLGRSSERPFFMPKFWRKPCI